MIRVTALDQLSFCSRLQVRAEPDKGRTILVEGEPAGRCGADPPKRQARGENKFVTPHGELPSRRKVETTRAPYCRHRCVSSAPPCWLSERAKVKPHPV